MRVVYMKPELNTIFKQFELSLQNFEMLSHKENIVIGGYLRRTIGNLNSV
jgi:hypothetical protein